MDDAKDETHERAMLLRAILERAQLWAQREGDRLAETGRLGLEDRERVIRWRRLGQCLGDALFVLLGLYPPERDDWGPGDRETWEEIVCRQRHDPLYDESTMTWRRDWEERREGRRRS